MKTHDARLSEVRLYRFGPYELDLKRNELRKFGVRLRLEPKPMHLLVALLDHSGAVVTRAQLRQLLWGKGVFVDFEKGLSVVVTKLRAALNDSAEEPKYIETIAGEGYRFIAEAERVLAATPVPGPEQVEQSVPPSVPGNNQAHQPEPAQGPLVTGSVGQPWRKQRLAQLGAVLGGILLLATMAAVKRIWRRTPEQERSGKLMLVVLPFENFSSDSNLEYLSDGITEELSTQLGNLNPQRLGVIGRTSAMVYKHRPQPISQIGKELGVGYVLEGSVRRTGEKLRVTAQLVEVSDQAHVWAGEYDRNIRDLVQVEDEVAREITRQVGVSVALESPQKLQRHTPDPEAHQAYLLGRYYWNKRTPAGYGAGAEYFRRAIARDPQYAAAYAGLAESGIPVSEAKAAALKAVELDPSSGEARTALGFIELFREVDVPEAEKTLKTAIELDPNYATAHHWYAFALEATGRAAESRAEIAEAAKLDPLSLIIRSSLAGALAAAGQPDAAMAQIKVVFDMDPNFPKGHGTLGYIYEQKGMYEAALREYELSDENGGDPMWAERGYVYAISGHRQEALAMLAHLQAQEERAQGSAVEIALVNLGLGRREEAISWLQRALAERNDGWLMLGFDRRFDPLRSDPRFQDLLRRMKLLS